MSLDYNLCVSEVFIYTACICADLERSGLHDVYLCDSVTDFTQCGLVCLERTQICTLYMSKRRFQIYTFRCCVTTPSAPFYTLDTGVVPSRLDLQCVVHNDSRNLPIYTVYTSESKPSWSTACICAPPFTNIADMAWITTKNSNIPRPCTRTSPSCNSHTAPLGITPGEAPHSGPVAVSHPRHPPLSQSSIFLDCVTMFTLYLIN